MLGIVFTTIVLIYLAVWYSAQSTVVPSMPGDGFTQLFLNISIFYATLWQRIAATLLPGYISLQFF
jgi:hypothetical protein